MSGSRSCVIHQFPVSAPTRVVSGFHNCPSGGQPMNHVGMLQTLNHSAQTTGQTASGAISWVAALGKRPQEIQSYAILHYIGASTHCWRPPVLELERDPSYNTAVTPLESSETADSISLRVILRPRLKRIAPIPSAGGMFIARNTGDNATEPE